MEDSVTPEDSTPARIVLVPLSECFSGYDSMSMKMFTLERVQFAIPLRPGSTKVRRVESLDSS